MNSTIITTLSVALEFILQLVFIVRVLLRPNRQPASRIAWIAVIAAVPVVGIIVYIWLGETNIGRKRLNRRSAARSRYLEKPRTDEPGWDAIPEEYRHLFRTGKSVNGFDPVSGNRGVLMRDSGTTISSMVADMDAAADHIHLEFYIWLTDESGIKVIEALIRAAARGIVCRAMADSLGSRSLIRSKYWKKMRDSGVQLVETLPVRNPLISTLFRRIDLRNHRKILVIDNRITYCGSRNCADPEFRVKPKFAPWVDAMIRFEGPIVRQNQYMFISDWMQETDDEILDTADRPVPYFEDGFPCQVIGTGPAVRHSAMPEVFESLMYAARRELVISTPYYVPDEAMQTALCASARRGVRTTIIFPARIDSTVTAAACRSNYAELLDAGVNIYEYLGGLLHTKSLTVDGEVTLIGSANMDRRSFELNYENNILFRSRALTADVRERQQQYIGDSRLVDAGAAADWPWYLRLWNNTLAMLGPLL